jgi:hypothetical protein
VLGDSLFHGAISGWVAAVIDTPEAAGLDIVRMVNGL